MKAVIQRARSANVSVNGKVTGKIDSGLVVLLGVTHDDTPQDASYLANKIGNIRIFEDENGKMNFSVKNVGGDVLSISQFTLYGDCTKGRRPNFMEAAKADTAKQLYETFNHFVEQEGIHVETGVFGEMMDVQLTNDGPVTLMIDSRKKRDNGK
ncbi:D-aminoacyl-tRNA deacylase [Aquibacillus sp. 3ASR75-11]|uniref:D-aminoacyl-tRNA deacylase n=1 Tax=Terrihalobacillus insolitus TaxID=2950438 RepID=A0A9X4AMT7_9BACI|nr:D-aminoacyl-tRNA deacylase [Terrihalobacillus insolitus]MDC3412428.1 D-aminoacyl-tRNA deacylase [Terrihalobacillus insolitus]MDC3423848.1 D-aminoacyl-tRNA deacylase [Terrihalobacillus insolitus]